MNPKNYEENLAAQLDAYIAVQQQDADQTANAADKLVLAAEAGDVGAPFEPAALATLRDLRTQDFPSWVRLRDRLKKAGVGVTELDKQLQRGVGAPPEEDETVADKLIALARSQCQFLHDAQRLAYAVFEAAGARQVYSVDRTGFSEYMSHAYYTDHDRAPTETSLKASTLRTETSSPRRLHERSRRTPPGRRPRPPSGWCARCRIGLA